MPTNGVQWVFFTFYTFGSFGGLIALALMVRDILRGRQ